MKSCELCKRTARIYCESDRASLCWPCDVKVHSANFLVAKHLRGLLCYVCQSPTAWSASGEKLGRTISVCERCVCNRMKLDRGGEEREENRSNDDEIDTGSEYESDGVDDDEDEDDQPEEDDEDENEDGDNQVVPWSSTQPPPAASSSSSVQSSCRFSNGDVSSKRSRESSANLCSDDDIGCSSSHHKNQTILTPATAADHGGGLFVDSLSFRPLKLQKFEANGVALVQQTAAGLGSSAIVGARERFHQQDKNSVNEAPATVDLNFSECP